MAEVEARRTKRGLLSQPYRWLAHWSNLSSNGQKPGLVAGADRTSFERLANHFPWRNPRH
jgi:hypothetical protein